MKRNLLKSIVLASALALSLSGCGKNSNSAADTAETMESASESVSESAVDSAEETSTEEVAASVASEWEAVNGLSGSISYAYNEDGTISEMSLINGVTGNLYRRIVYSYFSDSYGSTCTREIYNANSLLLYTYREQRNTEGYLSYSSGYDQYRQTSSSSLTYTGTQFEQRESSTRSNDFGGSDDYWLITYDGEGRIAERDRYFKDSAPISQEIYDYSQAEEDIAYTMTLSENGITVGTFIPSLDENGHVTQYVSRTSEDQTPDYTFTYDAEGRVTRWTSFSRGEEYSWRELTYDADGNISKCLYHYNQKDYIFTFENGNLVTRNGIMTSIGSGDIGHLDYEYYDNGVIKRQVAYSYDYDPEHYEYIFTFAEDGHLTSQTTYDYTYDGEGANSGWRDDRTTICYREDGTSFVKIYCVEETEKSEGKITTTWLGENSKPISTDYHGSVQAEGDLDAIAALVEEAFASQSDI